MNNKGEMNMVGYMIVIAVTLVVGLVLFQVIAQEVGESTSTVTLANQSLTGAAVNDTAQYITNCRALSDVKVFNATGDVEVGSGNYTITNNVVYNGALAVQIVPGVSATPELGYKVGVWTIDGTCQPLDYIADSGGRAMASLIVIMFALAVLVVALTPTLRSGVVDMVTR